MTHYVGLLDRGEGVWGVRLPDIDGCVGVGETAEAAIANVTEALREVATYKREGGFALPLASTVDEVIASGEVGEHESVVLIPLRSRP